MRIISNFKDYYDPVQKLGQDRDCVYLRQKKVVDKNKKYNKIRLRVRNDIVQIHYIIGFCGKIYKCLYLDKFAKNMGTDIKINKFVYSKDEDIQTINEYIPEDWRIKYLSRRYKSKWNGSLNFWNVESGHLTEKFV